MSANPDRPEQAGTADVHHVGDQHRRRDFNSMPFGFAAFRKDKVDGTPKRGYGVRSCPGQGGYQNVMGKVHDDQRLVATAWFTRH